MLTLAPASSARPQRKLSCPAPRKVWLQSDRGWYSTHWTTAEVLSALSGGAWFASGHHSFDSTETALLAMGREKGKGAKSVIAKRDPLSFDDLDAALDTLYAEVTRD